MKVGGVIMRSFVKPKVAFSISSDKTQEFKKEISKADAPTINSSVSKVKAKLEMLYAFYEK